MFNFFKQTPKNVSKGALGLGVAGSLAYAILISPWEGNILKPYLDIGGVPTACMGVTGPKITKAYNEGVIFDEEQCLNLNIEAVAKHEKCVNEALTVKVNDLSKAAFISFDYNTGRFPTSTMVRLVNEGKLKEACEELPRWAFVKGIKISGLENRRFKGDRERISERTLCLIGLDASYKTPLFEKWYVSYRNWATSIKDGIDAGV